MINNVSRKIKTWDFSSRLVVRKKIIDSFYIQDKSRYSSEIRSLGIWAKNYLIELGPTFIKLGQTFSTRKDLFPEEFISELEKLQDNVTEIPPGILKLAISEQLNEPIEQTFEYFDYSPYKSASLGQVHKAKLKSGKKVAVKIQRPYVREIINEDIETILQILSFFDLIGYSTGPSAKLIFEEAKQKLFDELDYSIEAKNAIMFRKSFENVSWVVVPRVYVSKSTDKLLIMEWVGSIKITDKHLFEKYSIDSNKISNDFIKFFIIQTMEYGFFHADPHPGNIGINSSGKLVIYDFGLVVKLPENIQIKLKEMITYIIQRDTRSLVDLFISIGIINPNSSKYEIEIFFNNILNYLQKIENVNDPTIKDQIISKLSQEKPFTIPSSFIFLGKTLSIIEGISTQLDPEFSFYKYLTPYVEENIMDSIDLQKMASSTLEMPSKINYISNSMSNLEQQKSEMDIKLNRYEKLIKNTNYFTISLIIINNAMLSQSYIESDIMIFLFVIYLIIQRIGRRW